VGVGCVGVGVWVCGCVVCGCVVCGVWCVVCGVWCVVCGVLCCTWAKEPKESSPSTIVNMSSSSIQHVKIFKIDHFVVQILFEL
jgi:hypothetical protein